MPHTVFKLTKQRKYGKKLSLFTLKPTSSKPKLWKKKRKAFRSPTAFPPSPIKRQESREFYDQPLGSCTLVPGRSSYTHYWVHTTVNTDWEDDETNQNKNTLTFCQSGSNAFYVLLHVWCNVSTSIGIFINGELREVRVHVCHTVDVYMRS